jgi:ATP-dependent DNA helicase RecG
MMVKFDPRKLMEQAIEVMRSSVSEARADGKASPLVGAVLWKPDGTVQTACRGELRDGDHAEYTLLERKSRDSRLDDAVLFATLEPCAPGSRRHPKLGCAERIALARIKRVWIGIEDPDPTVDRKGIKYLQEKGVKVEMFDRDLQEIIRNENKDFISQALERAEAARTVKKVEPITLSPLENATSAELADLSTDALEQYRRVAGIRDAVGSPVFNRRLIQLDLIKSENQRSAPTGFGLLLFGKEPRNAMPEAGLLGTIQFSNGTEELRDFDGPQVLVPDQVLQWLRDKLPSPIIRSGARRRQANDALFELVREGVVNALVHRDYGVKGAKCHLIATDDTITVRSPGRPLEPITLEQLQSFTAPMLSRNPIMHYVFAQMELAEERGLGLRSMRTRAAQLELPLPSYSWGDPYLSLTLYRSSDSAMRALSPKVKSEMGDDEQAVWTYLAQQGAGTLSQVMRATGFDERKSQRLVKKMEALGLVRRLGKGRATRYEVLRP